VATTGRSRGGTSWPVALLAAGLAWWTLTLGTGASTWCFLDLVNLAFHEAGHLAFRAGGTTLHYLGGTLGQLLVPALLAAYFLIGRREPLGAACCTWWAGESLVNVAVYMRDARSLALPLVGGGDHDWNELFYRLGLLGERSVTRCAGSTHVVGTAAMVVGLAWTVYFALPGETRERFRDRLTSRWPWLEPALES
jgi:hypothetical protein